MEIPERIIKFINSIKLIFAQNSIYKNLPVTFSFLCASSSSFLFRHCLLYLLPIFPRSISCSLSSFIPFPLFGALAYFPSSLFPSSVFLWWCHMLILSDHKLAHLFMWLLYSHQLAFEFYQRLCSIEWSLSIGHFIACGWPQWVQLNWMHKNGLVFVVPHYY